ncbi:hypothetical protein VTL71DRAFT_11700 [Oculimacula yallundae]|uniref:Uncharacterized protein n=1 Tax=Oculimacula yallundae TaxID=86028 RepID=A0ABR4CRI1_9HELO
MADFRSTDSAFLIETRSIIAQLQTFLTSTHNSTSLKPQLAPPQSTKTTKFTMDFVNKFTGGDKPQGENNQNQQSGSNEQSSSGGGGFLGSIGDKFNSAAGGGKESEKNEDYLDKGIDFVQEKFMGQGKQDNESAIEQAKDEQISDFVRGQYKSTTGSDIPIKDKETRFG